MSKKLYEQPIADILVVRSEGVICGSFDRDNGTEKFTSDYEEEDL